MTQEATDEIKYLSATAALLKNHAIVVAYD
jgi:hypothetical protein